MNFKDLSLRERIRLIATHPGVQHDPQAIKVLEELSIYQQANPVAFFEPLSEPQDAFMKASTPIVAAFAGNQFGKTTGLVMRALLDCLPLDYIPEHLKGMKRWPSPTRGRLVSPDLVATLEGVLLPAFRQWAPPEALVGGRFDKAWDKQRRILNFKCGSWIQFMTYEQDLDKFGGAQLHFVGYDEPPPKVIRQECLMRLVRFGGYEMFAMTPLKANTGWVRRDIWKQRESPSITVVKGSIHDNPTLNAEAKDRILSQYTDLWRQAREFGDFVEVGGLIYPEFERSVLKIPPPPKFVRELDIVVGIDPGIRNAGIVWVGFDQENRAFVFQDELLQDKDVNAYVQRIRAVNNRWGIDKHQIMYVVDPSARSRGHTNAETVLSLLIQRGLPTNPGQNDRDAGFNQLRIRMAHQRFFVSPECRGLRDEADDYAAEEPDEGKDDSHLVPIKGNDHRLDALRYAVMTRVWDPIQEDAAPRRNLGWVANQAPPAEALIQAGPYESPPMGSMS